MASKVLFDGDFAIILLDTGKFVKIDKSIYDAIKTSLASVEAPKSSHDEYRAVVPAEASKPSHDEHRAVAPAEASKPSHDEHRAVAPAKASKPSHDEHRAVAPVEEKDTPVRSYAVAAGTPPRIDTLARGGAGGPAGMSDQDILNKFIENLNTPIMINNEATPFIWIVFMVYMKALIFNKTHKNKSDIKKFGMLGMPPLWFAIVKASGCKIDGTKSISEIILQMSEVDASLYDSMKTDIAYYLSRYSHEECNRKRSHDNMSCTYRHSRDNYEFYNDSARVLSNIINNDKEGNTAFKTIFGRSEMSTPLNVGRVFNVITLTLTTVVGVAREHKTINVDFSGIGPTTFGMSSFHLDTKTGHQELCYDYEDVDGGDVPSNDGHEEIEV